jgi:hypothetical protein
MANRHTNIEEILLPSSRWFSTIYKPSPSPRRRVSSTVVCHPDNKGGIRALPAARPGIDLLSQKATKRAKFSPPRKSELLYFQQLADKISLKAG